VCVCVFEGVKIETYIYDSHTTLHYAQGIKKIQEKGCMSEGRASQLINFPWNNDGRWCVCVVYRVECRMWCACSIAYGVCV
jgi:hypothetical protein